MRDSSSVPAILSLRSQMRMASSCSSVKLARSGAALEAWVGELLSLSCDASTSTVYQTVAWAASENCTGVRRTHCEGRGGLLSPGVLERWSNGSDYFPTSPHVIAPFFTLTASLCRNGRGLLEIFSRH